MFPTKATIAYPLQHPYSQTVAHAHAYHSSQVSEAYLQNPPIGHTQNLQAVYHTLPE